MTSFDEPAMNDERCRKHVPGCQCDWHDEDWRRFAAEYGIDLPEIDDTCRHHTQQEVRHEQDA